jgi:alkanesulfonate monooxygenase SsuD/methylene tetrahydromethanopterin reductase-like flavin-dependent oxidoreductase (luciferase family)
MPLEFGLDFFPDMRPNEKSGAEYYAEALRIVQAGEELGSTRVKTVEHYFHPYGGYSPDPAVFLSACAALTKRQRLMTGAVLPAFSHPLKLAGQLAMLDCISGGRLDAGIARAFLPHEFAAFGVPMDESRGRFEEGIDALQQLWTRDEVTFHGKYWNFERVSSLPKPVQQPHPPIWIAAIATPASFQWAGEHGYAMMVVPYLADFDELADHLALYRESFRRSGAAGQPRVMMVMHCVIDPERAAARERAWSAMQHYIGVFRDIASWWEGRTEAQYAHYDDLPRLLDTMTWDRVDRENRAIVGDPAAAVDKTQRLLDTFGECDLSLQVHFGGITAEQAIDSLRLFAEQVNPRVGVPAAASAG